MTDEERQMLHDLHEALCRSPGGGRRPLIEELRDLNDAFFAVPVGSGDRPLISVLQAMARAWLRSGWAVSVLAWIGAAVIAANSFSGAAAHLKAVWQAMTSGGGR